MIICLVLAKEKLETSASSSEPYQVYPSIYSILGTEKPLFTCIIDHGRTESRLPSLARVLLCLVRVGVSWMSWAVGYLDKPWWRAVNFPWVYLSITSPSFDQPACKGLTISNWRDMLLSYLVTGNPWVNSGEVISLGLSYICGVRWATATVWKGKKATQ